MNHYKYAGNSLLVDIRDRIALVTLNRPEQMNAFSRELRNNFHRALNNLNDDVNVGVIILTGAGPKAFSAGVDLKELDSAPLQAEEMGVDCQVMQAFAELQKPTIAAINGYAVAGGLEVAINCDILVASSNARFADTHARVGVVPAWGVTQNLAMLIGPMRARYMSFTGNYIDAMTAKEWGLVLEVVSYEDLVPHCLRLAKEILSCDAKTLGAMRTAMHVGLTQSIQQGLNIEAKLAKACLEDFDSRKFGTRRNAVFSRGKEQVTYASGSTSHFKNDKGSVV